RRRPAWPWALLAVTCLQLLTASGTWLMSDQAEMIFTARRLITATSFDFAAVGERVRELPWLQGVAGQPVRPGLFPGVPVAFLPFVALDQLLRLDRTRDMGVFVHFSGQVFVGAALLLLARTARREGVSDRAVSAMILVVGTVWPVWQISRRAGA